MMYSSKNTVHIHQPSVVELALLFGVLLTKYKTSSIIMSDDYDNMEIPALERAGSDGCTACGLHGCIVVCLLYCIFTPNCYGKH